MLEEFLALGSTRWWGYVVVVLAARACDLISTWIATPTLALEANPVTRRIGWRGGILLQVVLVPILACWPMLAISVATTSVLVAARNFQHAWIMRSLGEDGYRRWFSDRVADSPRWLVRASFLAEAALTASVGVVLMAFGEWRLFPFGIGLGILAYGVAVAVFTLWSVPHR